MNFATQNTRWDILIKHKGVIFMNYSKSRPKIIASAVMDALSTFAYFVLAILFVVAGIVLINAEASGGDGTASGVIQEGATAISTALVGVLSIIVGIICIVALLISLVGTVVSFRSINKSVGDLKKSLNRLKIATVLNYAATGVFFIGAIYDFTQCGNDATLIAGACVLLAVSVFRCVSGILKTLAIKEINAEQVEQEQVSFFDTQNGNEENLND